MSDLQSVFPTALTQYLFLEISLGNIPGMSVTRKFFENPNFDGTQRDIWDYGGTVADYVYTADAGADYYIASTDNANTQDVAIFFLDEFKDEYSVVITLQGNTPIKINDVNNTFISLNKRNTPFKCTRIWRVVNISNPGIDFGGSIFVTEGNNFAAGVPQVNADVRAYVNNGNNTTLMSQYTVPNGHVGLFYVGYLSITKKTAESAEIGVWARDEGSVFILQEKLDTNTQGSGNTDRKYDPPIFVSEKTDLKFRGDATGACGISGSYNMVIVKNEFAGRAAEILSGKAVNK